MFTITIKGDDRGILNIEYTGDQQDFIDLNNPTNLDLTKYWINCINIIDNYYQNHEGNFPLKELERLLS